MAEKKTAKATKKKASAKKAAGPKAEAGAPEIAARTASATINRVRISPRRLRLEIGLIKGRQVEPALQILRHSPRKASRIARRLLESAIANARETKGLDVDRLWITDGWVNNGQSLWRMIPRAQGRMTPIQKRTAHATVILTER